MTVNTTPSTTVVGSDSNGFFMVSPYVVTRIGLSQSRRVEHMQYILGNSSI